MREIKFRAWDGKRFLTQEDNNAEDEWYGDGFPILLGVIASLEKDGIILEQFTGLRDKNGKEIYEGDIVRYQDNNTTEKTVKIANVYWMAWADWANVPFLHPFGSPVSGKDDGEGRSVNICYVTPPNACEVIGNIHENPELLTPPNSK